MIRQTAFLLLLPIIFLFSCTDNDNKLIEQTLDMREKAYESGDVELFMTLVSPNYLSIQDGRTVKTGELKKYFEGLSKVFDKIDLSHSNRSIYLDGDKAKVVQKSLVKIEIVEENIKTNFVMNEVIEMEKSNGKWLIVKEPEKDYIDGFVFGG